MLRYKVGSGNGSPELADKVDVGEGQLLEVAIFVLARRSVAYLVWLR